MKRLKENLRFAPLLLPVLLGLATWGCVTLVRTYKVDISVDVPCESWPSTDTDGQFSVEVFRAVAVIQDANNIEIQCERPISAQTSCDSQVGSTVKFGFLPELIGVRVTSPSGKKGYAVERILGAGQKDIQMGPELNDWVLADYCREVATCLFGAEAASDYCLGLAQPFEDVTPTPEPGTTPTEGTPTPAQTSPTPTDETPTPAQATPTPAQATPTPAQATPTPAQATPTPAEGTPEPTPGSKKSTTAGMSKGYINGKEIGL